MRSLLLVTALLLAVGSTGCTIVRTRGFDASEPSVYATPPPAISEEALAEANDDDEDPGALFVEKGGSYWPAEMLGRLPDGRSAMRVKTNASTDDEVVTPSRILADAESTRPARRGEHLFVEWHGSYWPAMVLSIGGGVAHVHYDNYGTEWDEDVASERLKRLVPGY
jgi:hypothetical protein